MAKSIHVPEDYSRIVVVDDFSGLFSRTMQGGVNCIVLPRKLQGDFESLAMTLAGHERDSIILKEFVYGLVIDEFLEACRFKQLSPEEKLAVEQIRADCADAGKNEFDTRIRIIAPGAYEDQVYQFHIDGYNAHNPELSFPERLMCSYNLASTEILRNEDVAEEIVDSRGRVTYKPRPDARPVRFALGDIYRQQNYRHGKECSPAAIHKAPFVSPSLMPRIALVGFPRITL